MIYLCCWNPLSFLVYQIITSLLSGNYFFLAFSKGLFFNNEVPQEVTFFYLDNHHCNNDNQWKHRDIGLQQFQNKN